MSDMNTENNLDNNNKKKNSFRDTVLIVFVVLICFGLTIFAISVLLSSMSSGDLIDGDSEGNRITSDIVTPRVITDPNEGGTLSIDKNNKEDMRDKTVVVPQVETREKPVKKKKDTTKPKAVKDVTKTPAKKVVPKKVEPKVEPKPVAKAEPKSTTYSEKVEPGSPTEGKFVLQLMALQSEKDANNAVKKYKVACADIFVMKIDLENSGTWYRVRCGITNSMDEAVALKQKLATDYKIYADLIKNK